MGTFRSWIKKTLIHKRNLHASNQYISVRRVNCPLWSLGIETWHQSTVALFVSSVLCDGAGTFSNVESNITEHYTSPRRHACPCLLQLMGVCHPQSTSLFNTTTYTIIEPKWISSRDTRIKPLTSPCIYTDKLRLCSLWSPTHSERRWTHNRTHWLQCRRRIQESVQYDTPWATHIVSQWYECISLHSSTSNQYVLLLSTRWDSPH